MSKTKDADVLQINVTGNKENSYSDDPINNFQLGSEAYKIEEHDAADTEPDLKGAGISYYAIRGGEIVSKEFDDPVEKKTVIFNKGRKDQFELPVDPKPSVLRRKSADRWYSDKSEAVRDWKLLTETEQDRARNYMDKWNKLINMYDSQLEKEAH